MSTLFQMQKETKLDPKGHTKEVVEFGLAAGPHCGAVASHLAVVLNIRACCRQPIVAMANCQHYNQKAAQVFW